jgi:ribose transport system permease protein/L-arabinose transport system permease protein
VNGLIVTALRVNPVIATLATLSAVRGLSFLVAPGGKPVGVLDSAFTNFGSGRVYLGFEPGIPYTVFLFAAVAVSLHLVLRYTTTGRAIYAIGGNERAARLAGIRLTRLRLLLYGLSGAAAGLAGAVLAAQTFIGAPDSSTDLVFDVITACFLGGCALEGGRGTVVGVVLAVTLLGVLNDGMSLLGIQTFYQLVAKGLLLVLAVAIQQWRARRAERVELTA